MREVRGVLAFLLIVALAGLIGAPGAQARDLLPDNSVRSTAHLIPFYDTSAGHASFLIVHNPGFPLVAPPGFAGFDAGVTVFFYDQTCAKKADQWTLPMGRPRC